MKKIAPIIILTVISVLLIFYRFGDIPRYLAYDEVEFAKLSLSLDNKPYIPYSQLATGHSTLYFYILLASLKIFGVSTFALRFPAVVFGVLSVLLFYLIMKKTVQENVLYRQGIALSLPIILLSSRWFLNFSRFSFEATFLLFLELTSIYFLLKADTKMTNFIATLDPAVAGRLQWSQKNLASSISSSFYLFISGLFAGLTFLSYTPGRIFFLLPIGFLIINSYRRGMPRLYNTIIIKNLLLFLIPFVIIITPLTLYLLNNKDTRIDQQFFLKNHEMTIDEKVNGLWSNISSTTLMFVTSGDMNGRHNYPGKPALNPILGSLFVIGFILSIKNFKNLYNKLFLFYFLISLFPALMTYPWENPNMLRTFTVLPSVVYFIGIACAQLIDRFKSNKILMILLFAVLLSSAYELRTYFKYQSIVFKESFDIRLPLEKAIKVILKP